MFEVLRPVKLLTISVLIIGWLAMGFGIFADQLDSTTLNTGTTGIFVEDGDDGGLDETKTCSFSRSFCGAMAAFSSGTAAERVIVINLLKELLNTSSMPRYKMLCVYRL